MAKASIHLVSTIRSTANKLEKSEIYQWGHMGACNCGFLAQEITKLSKEEIHRRAMMKHGDWNEQLNDYCPTSGLPMDDMISTMISFGFDADDLRNLERLSDGTVLATLPVSEQALSQNRKTDVIKYLRAWSAMLEDQLLESFTLDEVVSELIPAPHQ